MADRSILSIDIDKLQQKWYRSGFYQVFIGYTFDSVGTSYRKYSYAIPGYTVYS